MLADHSASPVQLSSKLDATLGTVAYHVRRCTASASSSSSTPASDGGRPSTTTARASTRGSPTTRGPGLAPVAKQRMLSAMLQQIGQYVTGSAAAGGFDRSEAHMTRNALRLDERGWQQLATATRKWLREAEKIQESAAQRIERAAGGRRRRGGDGTARSTSGSS